MTEQDVEALAKKLRQSRLSWGTHADRWLDAEWQTEFWREAAQIASDWYAGRLAEAWHEGHCAGVEMQHLIETGEDPWPDHLADNPYGVPTSLGGDEGFTQTAKDDTMNEETT